MVKKPRKPRLGSAKRAGKARSLAALANPVAKKALGGRPLALRELILSWRSAVGPDFAACTRPQSLNRARAGEASLTLTVNPGDALMVQHETQRLIERVNTYFGYRLIGRIKLVQRPIARPPEAQENPIPPTVTDQDRKAIGDRLAKISDQEARSVLQEMGELLAARRRRQKSLQKSGIAPN